MDAWKLLTDSQKLLLIAKLESEAKVKRAVVTNLTNRFYNIASTALETQATIELEEINRQLTELK